MKASTEQEAMSRYASLKSYCASSRLVWTLLPLQIAYGVYVLIYLRVNGILPAPFFYDPTNTFMDFFNTNYWAFQEGRYEQWQAIYPIFVFFIAKFFTSISCVQPPLLLRSCDTGAIVYLVIAYLAGTALCARRLASQAKRTGNGREGPAWFVVIALNISGLFALERGNYIVIAFLFLALAAFYEDDWKSALFLALAINIKQYLAILWLVPLIKRRFDLVFLGLVFALIPNILGLIFVPELHYGLLLDNMFQFSTTSNFSLFEKIWMPTSLAAWLRVMDTAHAVFYMEGWRLEGVKIALSSGLWLARGLFVAALGLALTGARPLSTGFLSFICLIGFTASTDSPGGYSLLLLLPFAASIRSRPYGLLMEALLIVIFMPLGMEIGPATGAYQDNASETSFLTGRLIESVPEISLGSYARPLLIAGLLAVIVLDIFEGRRKTRPRSTVTAASVPE